MATPVILGTPNDVVFGTAGIDAGTLRLTRAGKNIPANVDPSLDNNGIPTGGIMTADMLDQDYEFERTSGFSLPAIGDSVTLRSSDVVYVKDIKISDTRGKRSLGTISFIGFPA